MATADQIIELAHKQVGYIEVPNNRTKYGQWYGLDGNPWCDMFISWLFNECGALNINHGKNAYTPSHAQRFKNAGQWGNVPRKGAIVFFNFGGNRIHHVGLVVNDTQSPIHTIEGNTSRGSGGSQRDGGGVWERRRSTGIVGYGYPAYDLSAPSTPGPEKLGPYPGRVFQEGDTGDHVRAIQRALNRTNLEPKIDTVPGRFGPRTKAAVINFQRARRIEDDGKVGPQTWGELRNF